jgi:TIR domain
MEKPGGHAFISYVREDSRDADILQWTLEAAAISVWRDTADLWPGEDWRVKIRRAITDNALVFIACFSSRSIAREKSYQNEELLLAIEQLRLRRPDDPWLIPVRFDNCNVPDLEIGGGRSLASIHYADLFGDRRDAGIARLIAAILRILGQRSDLNVKWQPENAQLNASVMEESRLRKVSSFVEAGSRKASSFVEVNQKPNELQYGPATESVGSTTRYSTAGDPLPAVSGHNSKVLEMDLPSGRYLINWNTKGEGYFSIRDESEMGGKGRILVSAVVPNPSPAGEKVVRIGENGRHLLSVTAGDLDWTFIFTPI